MKDYVTIAAGLSSTAKTGMEISCKA